MRKVIQIAVMPMTEESHPQLYALCNDGTIWRSRQQLTDAITQWWRLEEPPQPTKIV